MMKNTFLIESKTGRYKIIDDLDGVEDLNQVLVVEGADSEFVENLAITYENGRRESIGSYLISKYSNSQNEPELSVVVGNYTVRSIKRQLPRIEFEFEYLDNRDDSMHHKVFSSCAEGLHELANEN